WRALLHDRERSALERHACFRARFESQLRKGSGNRRCRNLEASFVHTPLAADHLGRAGGYEEAEPENRSGTRRGAAGRTIFEWRPGPENSRSRTPPLDSSPPVFAPI